VYYPTQGFLHNPKKPQNIAYQTISCYKVQGKCSHIFKNIAFEVRLLYQKDKQQTIDDFVLPFGSALLTDNRWVIKAEMIPWDDIEDDYSDLFSGDSGNVVKPARLAFGALIIKETLGSPMKKPSSRSGRTPTCSTL
jgi:hypothetical protein